MISIKKKPLHNATLFLRDELIWCSQCKERKPVREVKSVPLEGGLRQRRICITCLESIKLRETQ